MPESASLADSLISSSTLPEFADIDRIFEEEIAKIESEEEKKNAETIPEKKKRGRKKKTDSSSEPPVDSDEKGTTENATEISFDPVIIEELVCLPFDMMFERQEKKKLVKSERKALSEAVAKVANKYVPAAMSRYDAEIQLCVALSMIMIPRMKKEKKFDPVEETKDLNFSNGTTTDTGEVQ